MHARGPAARPTAPPPPFAARLTKVTGEGEQLEVTIVADDPEALGRAVAAVGAIASARLKANNDAIVAAAATLEDRTRAVYADVLAQLRRELGLTAKRREPADDEPAEEEEPPLPADEDVPAEDAPEEEASSADSALRALHAPADP